MCGIIAISSVKGKNYQLDQSLVKIKHRGPDDQGVFASRHGDCHLGQVRLSIIDLSDSGHQPMLDSSGRFVISFNGEIYNYQDLKNRVEKNHGAISWKSTSDTEVVLEGFAKEGVSFLSHLNGMFSIAVYDIQKKLLHILRDPLGIKPLVYTEQNGAVFFCSELKGLTSLPGLKKTLRHQSLADQLAFMYVPEPHTLYEEFQKVEPGVCTTYHEGMKVSSVSLFDHLGDAIPFSSEQEIIESFYNTFSSAVERQLMSDVPVSLMLSGGLDSSAVAYEAVRAGVDFRDVFTISFSNEDIIYDQQSDDLHYAKVMANKLGLNLQVIHATQDFTTLLPKLSQFLEDGISDPAAINTYLICEAARSSGVKVILTGQGADEFLCGYRRYLAERMIGWFPSILRVYSKLVSNYLPDNVPGKLNSANRRLKRLLTLAGKGQNERLLGMYIWGTPERIIGLFQQTNKLSIGRDLSVLFDKYKNQDVIDAMMRVDHKYDLMSLNLTYTDRMSMAVGIEARVPFLDFDLVRIINSIPAKQKMKFGTLKYVLKKAMEPYIPHEIVYREKAGFALPIRAWMRKDNKILRHFFNEDRICSQGIFNPNSLQDMCDEQFSGKRDHANTLFSMLCIQIWLESQGSYAEH